MRINQENLKKALVWFSAISLIFSILAPASVAFAQELPAEIAPTDNITEPTPDPDQDFFLGESLPKEVSPDPEESEPDPDGQTMSLLSGANLSNNFIGPDNAGLSPRNSGNFGVDELTGAFSYAYPITVPPGRAGLQPDLSLQYNHQQKNVGGVAGYGWQLNIPYIQRDNRFGADEIYEHNNFLLSLNGISDLVPISVDGSGYGTYGKRIEKDVPKIEFTSQNKWLVTDKLGTVYTFGSAAATRQDNPGDSSQIYKWMLEETRDTNDNFIRYEYYKDSGQIYPKKIFYTGHVSTDGIFEVDFQPFASGSPTENNILTTSYQSGFEAQTKFLLDSIDVKIDGALTISHDLGFITGQNKKLLAMITPEFYDGATPYTKDEMEFEYSSATTTYHLADSGYYVLPNDLDDDPGFSLKGDVFLDFNGDSLTDYSRVTCDTDGDVHIEAWLNDGVDGWSYATSTYSEFINASYSCDTSGGTYYTMPVAFANLNGDNLIDMLIDDDFFYINTGSTWQQSTSTLPVSLQYNTSGGQPPANQVIFRDMNADGYDDFIYNSHPSNHAAEVAVYIRDESSGDWDLDEDYDLSVDLGNSDCLTIGGDPFGYTDINSDGLPDIYYNYSCTYFNPPFIDEGLFLNNGQGLTETTEYGSQPTVSSFSGTGTTEQNIHYLSDFNRDGISDYGVFQRSKWTTVGGYWSNGTMSLFAPVFDTGTMGGAEYFDNDVPVAIADINGDQIQDVIHSHGETDDLYLGRAVKPDVLEKINYQSGAKTYIYYDYSGNEKDGSGNLENPELPFNIHVVKEVVSDNGSGEYQGARYFYRDGRTVSYLSSSIKDVFGFAEVEKQMGRAMPDIDFGTGADGAFTSSGNTTWTTNKNFTSLNIQSGHTITVEPQVVIKVQGNAQISGTLTAKGLGYRGGRIQGGDGESGDGPGRGGGGVTVTSSSSSGGGGAGYGATGQNGEGCQPGYCAGGIIYGNELLENIDKGSGGGSTDDRYPATGAYGGYGGGIVHLFANNLTVSGSINVDGNDGSDGNAASGDHYTGGAGGGSGGAIFIKTFESAVLGTNLAHALGGYGGEGVYDGGDGAVGRIRVESQSITGTTNPAYFSVGDFDYSIENTAQDNDLKKTVNLYHVAADSGFHLHGQLKQSKKYNAQGTLLAVSFQEWQESDLGNSRKFVSLENSSETDLTDTQISTAVEYTYDSYGNVLTKEKLGKVTINTTTGEITNELSGDERTITYAYAANTGDHIVALPKTETVSAGAESREKDYYYDALAHGQVSAGNLTKEDFLFDGVEIDRTYNSYGFLITETDPNESTSTISYDADNMYPAESTNPLDQSTFTAFNLLNGQLATSTAPNGLVTKNTFDAFGRLTQTKMSDPNSPSTLVTTIDITYEDDTFPRYKEITTFLDTSISVVSREYKNGLDQLIQTKTEMEGGQYSTVDFLYDALGRVTRESLPYFTGALAYSEADLDASAKIYTYDPLDRILTETTDVGVTSNEYDGLTTTVTDPNTNDKDLTRDAYGNLVEVKEHKDAATYTTSYEYNPFDELTKITDALGNVRNFTYDNLGRRLTAQDLHAAADGTYGTWSYEYDANGNLTQSTDPKSQVIQYVYDELNRVETEDYTGAGGTEVSYTYDSCDYGATRLCSVNAADADTSYDYNVLGLVSAESRTIASSTFETTFTYDRQGNTTNVVYPDSSEVKYIYNAAGQLEKIQAKEASGSFADLVVDFDYGPHGQATYQENSNGTATYNTFAEDELYRLTRKLTTGPGGMGGLSAGEGGFEILAEQQPDGFVIENGAVELTDERTAFGKIFLEGFNEKGEVQKRARLYAKPVHYVSPETGQLEDIDTTLASSDGRFTVSQTPYEASVPEVLQSEILRFRNKRHELMFSLPQGAKAVSVSGVAENRVDTNRKVVYDNALADGVDLEIIFDTDSVTKDAVIESIDALKPFGAGDQYEIPFLLTANMALTVESGGAVLEQGKPLITDGPVTLTDRYGTVSHIRPPRLLSSGQDKRAEPLSVRWELTDEGISLTKLIPTELLEKVEFPVRADVTVSYYSGSGDGYSSFGWNYNTWANTRGAAAGDYANYNNNQVGVYAGYYTGGGGAYYIGRAFMPIDSSGLPDGATITAATFNAYADSFPGAGGHNIGLVQTSQASTSSVGTADYDQIGFTEGATRIGVTTSGWKQWTLNGTGLSWISKTGYTKLGMASQYDIDNSAPPSGGGYYGGANIRSSDYTGTSNDPYLEITYTEGNSAPTAPTSLLTEGQTNPSGITDITPEFSALYNDSDDGDLANAFQLQVATTTAFTNFLWDSGQTAMATTTEGNRISDISYAGTGLTASTTYYWRLKLWDDEPAAGAFSTETASFIISSGGGGGETATSTIYAGAGDGYVYHENAVWSTAQGAAAGDDAGYTDASMYLATGRTSTDYAIERAFIPFDTSSLPDDATIESATLYVYPLYKENGDNDGEDYITLVQGFQSSPTTLSTADFDTAGDSIDNPTEGIDSGQRKDIGSVTTSQYLAFTLNSTGRSWINTTGYTKLALREGHDALDHVYAGSASTYNELQLALSEASGTSQDPYLVISYSTGSGSEPQYYEIIQDTNYTYDPVGNITKLDDDSETDANRNIVYGYDDLNRLTSATSTSTPSFTHSYSYSAIGNIASSTPAGTYTYAGTSYANPHAATSINGNTQTYDNNGNLLSDSTWNFAWDYQNRLTQTGSANATSTFAYDHSGSRVLMNDGQTTRVYASKYFNTSAGTPSKHVFAGDLLIATIQGSGPTSTIQYIHTDHLTGSSSATDDTGGVVQLLDYYPYGDLRIDDSYSTFDEQRKFTGHEYDRSTGLNYMGARYYNPAVGRFVSQDPVFITLAQLGVQLADPQSWNSYSYARNNPLRNVDPDGAFWDTVVDLGFTAWDTGRGIHALGNYAGDYASIAIGRAFNNSRLADSGRQNLSASGAELKSVAGSLAIDAVGTALPFVPVAGVRAISKVDDVIDSAKFVKNADITKPYQRPPNATVKAQKEAMQGQACHTCGVKAEKMYADHQPPLVKEYYNKGHLDLNKIRSIEAVKPQCPSCSNKQGGTLSNFSRMMKEKLGL